MKARLSLATLAVVLAFAPPSAGQTVNAGTVVARATQYVAAFVARFTRVVAEERYVQDASPGLARLALAPAQHRESAADFLLVKADESTGWMTFRDVFEVNKAAVRDRDERLTKLFLESPATAVSRAQAITDESARYNIGPRRTINNPLLALAFLQDLYRPRFSFGLKGQDRIDGVEARVLEFQETGSPTLIRGAQNRDVPANGRYWIDERTGSILKTELVVRDVSVESKVTVSFRLNDQLQVRLPAQMDEIYTTQGGTKISATAKYDHFRQFGVTTEEQAR